MSTDLNGLKRFHKNINKYVVDNGFADNVSRSIAERGEEIAKEKYGGQNIIVGVSYVGNGETSVYATGNGIAYQEFGTGSEGNGSYQGNLPKQTITFESPKKSGDIHTTQGWEYNYPNPKTKINGGWYFGKTFTKGNKAQAQMWKTAEQLRKEVTDIVKKKFGNGGK